MKRLLTPSSAAVFFAAGFAAIAHAAPTLEPSADLPVTIADLLPAEDAPGIDAHTWMRFSLLADSPPIESPAPTASDARAMPDGPCLTTRIGQDVSDFIPLAWRTPDADVDAFGEAPESRSIVAEGLGGVSTSADSAMLSVPEIPLPLPLVPAAVGLIVVVYAHRRSLRRGNLSK